MKISFKYQFILSFVMIEIIFISLIVFFNFSSINNLSKSLIEEKIETSSKLFTQLIITPLIVDDLAIIDDAIKNFTSMKNIAAIKVLNSKNRVISRSYGNTIYKNIFNNGTKEVILADRTFRLNIMPIKVDNELLGRAEIIFEITKSLKTIEKNRNLTFLLVLLEITLSTLLAYVIGYKLTRSLSILTSSAEQIAHDDRVVIPDIKTNSSEILILLNALRIMQQRITERNNILKNLSITDTLTKLYNRRYFDEIFNREINRTKRGREIFCLLSLDIDNFKMYNDTYGHQMGDYVLSSIGKILRLHMRRSDDLAFRIGGEEFSVIYTVTDEKSVYAFAENIRKAIEGQKIEHKTNTASPYVTASIGVIFIDFNKNENATTDKATLYKNADDLLYRAKNSGKNMVILCNL